MGLNIAAVFIDIKSPTASIVETPLFAQSPLARSPHEPAAVAPLTPFLSVQRTATFSRSSASRVLCSVLEIRLSINSARCFSASAPASLRVRRCRTAKKTRVVTQDHSAKEAHPSDQDRDAATEVAGKQEPEPEQDEEKQLRVGRWVISEPPLGTHSWQPGNSSNLLQTVKQVTRLTSQDKNRETKSDGVRVRLVKASLTEDSTQKSSEHSPGQSSQALRIGVIKRKSVGVRYNARDRRLLNSTIRKTVDHRKSDGVPSQPICESPRRSDISSLLKAEPEIPFAAARRERLVRKGAPQQSIEVSGFDSPGTNQAAAATGELSSKTINLWRPFKVRRLNSKARRALAKDQKTLATIERFSPASYKPKSVRMSGFGTHRQSFHFQFITTPTADTPGTALFLHFDSKRYFFGRIAEGTQRACIQRGVGLKKIKDIFVTGRMGWDNHGGLIGAILTLSDVQNSSGNYDESGKMPRLDIHGGPGLMHTLACARRFVFRTGMPLSIHETFPDDRRLSTGPTWSDENVQVWTLPIASSEKNSSSDAWWQVKHTTEQAQRLRKSIISDMFDSDWRKDRLVEVPFGEVQFPAMVFVRDPLTKDLIPATRCVSTATLPHVSPSTPVLIRNPWPASLIGELPSATNLPRDVAISYIVRGYPQRGKFDPKLAKGLGVKPGPAFSVLTGGHPVQLEDGSVVTPDQVLGPSKPGRGIAIVDLPDKTYVDDLVSRPEWQNEELMNGIEAIVWIVDENSVYDPRLQKFMKSFPKLQHIVSSTGICPNYLAMDSSGASAIRLSKVWSEVFREPIHNNGPQRPLSSDSAVVAERGLRIQIEPKFELQRSEIPPFLNTARVIGEMPKNVIDLAVEARSQFLMAWRDEEIPDPIVITLGTGSAVPSKYRNVSATLLRLKSDAGSYLFDCGENTLGQLRRMYPPSKLRELLLSLRMIWISHLHADHHLGTISILSAVTEARAEAVRLSPNRNLHHGALPPLYVLGEENMVGFLQDYSSFQGFDHVQAVVASPSVGMTLDGKPFTFNGTGVPIKKIESCAVSHCFGAQAVSVTFENDFKFSYSGDCRPSAEFAKIGAHSDVLVHEATFDDEMEGDALAKKHSTTGEALAVGARMGAKNVILTHFSQRYQKIPVMGDVKLPTWVRFEEGTDFANGAGGPVDEAIDPEDNSRIPLPEPSAADTASLDALIARTLKPEQLPPLDMNVCVAFDYMRIKVSQIKEMERLTPALQALFNLEKNEEVQGVMTEKEQNELANRKKVKGKDGTKEKEGTHERVDAGWPRNEGNDGGGKPKSKTQTKKDRTKRWEEENTKGDGKEGGGKRAKLSDGETGEVLNRQRQKSNPSVVPPELIEDRPQSLGLQIKEATG